MQLQDRYVSAARLVLFVALGVGPLAGCAPADDKDEVHRAAPDGGTQTREVEARFALPASGAPDFLAVPFPTDLYRDGAGKIQVPAIEKYLPNGGPLLLGGLAGFDGFGTTAGALFAIDDLRSDGAAAALDVATLPADEAASTAETSTAMLVDLEATDASKAVVPSRNAYQDDADIEGTVPPVLTIFPGEASPSSRGTATRRS